MCITKTPEEGVALASKDAENGFDLILVGYLMPKKNGLEVVKEIVRANPKAKVWLMSTFFDDWLVKCGINAGAEKVLDKSKVYDTLHSEGII